MSKKKPTFEERRDVAIDAIEATGKFEYIDGYKTVEDDVLVRCVKCNQEQQIKARKFLYDKSKPYCFKCGDKHENELKDILNIEYMNNNFKHKDKEVVEIKENYIVYKCTECDSLYKYNETNSVRNLKSFLETSSMCCKSNGKTRYEKKAKSILKECWASLDNEFIREDEIEDYVVNYLSLMKNEIRQFVNTDYFKNEVTRQFKEKYEKQSIRECAYCGEMVKSKKKWGKIACVKCEASDFICQCCGRERPLTDFIIEDFEYGKHCKRCDLILKNLRRNIEDESLVYKKHKENIDKYLKRMKRD